MEELETEKAEIREESHRRMKELQERLRIKDSEISHLHHELYSAPGGGGMSEPIGGNMFTSNFPVQ